MPTIDALFQRQELDPLDFWRAFADSLPDMLLLVDVNGTIMYVNHVPHGVLADEVLGRSAFDYVPSESREELKCSLAGIFDGGQPHISVQRVIPADGMERWYSIHTGAVKLGTAIRAAAIVARDITERRKTKAQLREWQKMDALGKLAAGIAHDFNNVLSVIGSTAQLMQGAATGQQMRDDATAIMCEVNRGVALTSQLLNFAKRQEPPVEVVDLNEVIRGIVKAMRRVVDQRISLTAYLTDEPMYVAVSRSQLEQVVMNLLLNARDAIAGTGWISIETTALSSRVSLLVSDNGSGMTEDVLSQAALPFFTTKQATGGSGLGLSMVDAIVAESNGTIKIRSAPGEGTTVFVSLKRVNWAREI